MELFCAFMDKIRSRKGKSTFVNLKGHATRLWREKKTSTYYESLFMCYELMMDFTKKISSLVNLITSIMFGDLFALEKYS